MVVLIRSNRNLRGTIEDDFLKLGRSRRFGNRRRLVANGGDGDDVILGSRGRDKLLGGNGSDTLYGGRGNDTVCGGEGDDSIIGGSGNDKLFGNSGNDSLFGGRGRDRLIERYGSDVLNGGSGRDYIRSVSDNGEPVPAQDEEGLVDQFGDFGTFNPNDTLTGGRGRDVFEIRTLLDAKRSIIEQHLDEDGRIDWRGIAGENGNVHDHWVQNFGTDTITDYQAGIDKIKLVGHTIAIESVTNKTDEIGRAYTEILVWSDQGADGQGGGGAHDLDRLGVLNVYGDPVAEGDIEVNAGVFYGAYDNISQVPEVD